MDYGPDVTTYNGKKIGLYGGKFFPPHRGHVAMALEAAQHVDVLFVAVQWDQDYEQELINNTSFTYIAPALRVRWLTQVFKDYPHIRVISAYEKRTPDHLTDPELVEQYRQLEHRIGNVDIVFSGEPEYTPYFDWVLPNAQHMVLELEPAIPIAATMIREDVFQYWEYLPKPVQQHYARRVAFCGVESSGKTYLSHRLANDVHMTWIPEYGRTYFDELGGYTSLEMQHDYIHIVAGHLQQLHYSDPTPLLLLDTDAIYTQYFYMMQHGEKHPILEEVILTDVENIDTYLLLEPYIFDDDGTRQRLDETQRWENFARLKALYESYGKDVIVISGTGEERYCQARDILCSRFDLEHLAKI